MTTPDTPMAERLSEEELRVLGDVRIPPREAASLAILITHYRLCDRLPPPGDLVERAREWLAFMGWDKSPVNAPESLAALLTAVQQEAVKGVPADVRRLVIAARNVAFEDRPSREALKELDEASEAFAGRVPWNEEPTDAKA